MKIIYFFALVYFFISFISCSIHNNDSKIIIEPTHCKQDSDCPEDEICDVNYCVSAQAETTKAVFSLKFVPQNNINSNKYYHTLTTPIINNEGLKEIKDFTVNVSDYIEFSGEIKNNKDSNISYDLILFDKEKNIKFYNHSYKEGESTYFHFKIPSGKYFLKIIPGRLYPPFIMEVGELKNDINDKVIIIDREINFDNYREFKGNLKFHLDDSEYYPSAYKIYAFIKENNTRKIISNKFSCDNKCKNFDLMLQKTQKEIFLYITIEMLKNMEFKIPLKNIDDFMQDNTIILGNFYTSVSNKVKLGGSCNEIIANAEIKLKGIIGKYAYYENTLMYSCKEENCENTFSLYKGIYNILIKPQSKSCYGSEFLNIKLDDSRKEFKINLTKKVSVNGSIISTDANPIEGTITFTRKDNTLTDFRATVNSNENGQFKILLEPGEYDIFIKPQNSSVSNSNWIYLNQRITTNTKDLLYLVPKSYKIPFYLYAQGHKPLPQAQVTMYLHNISEIFSEENGYRYPENYPLYESITDSEGKFIISVPIIK